MRLKFIRTCCFDLEIHGLCWFYWDYFDSVVFSFSVSGELGFVIIGFFF
ncbi:hypothetical protein DsansV1_C25g0188871 [Dioscorea sansibarensis]